MTTRRYIVLWVNSECIVQLMGGWNQHLKRGGFIALPTLQEACWLDDGTYLPIPKDVAVLDATHSWERRAIGLRLAHPSFPEVADGMFPRSAALKMVMVHARRAEQADADSLVVIEPV
jgi:hypothetical protein